MRSEGTDLERDAVKFTAGFYSMASVITEMSTFSPFSISQEGLKIQVNSTQNCDSAKISQTKFLKTTFQRTLRLARTRTGRASHSREVDEG